MGDGPRPDAPARACGRERHGEQADRRRGPRVATQPRREPARLGPDGRCPIPPSIVRPKASQSVSLRLSVTSSTGSAPKQVVDRRQPERAPWRRSRQAGEEHHAGRAAARREGQGRQPDQGRQPGIPARRLVQVVDAEGPRQVGMSRGAGSRRRTATPCRRHRARAGGRTAQHGGLSRLRSPQTGLRDR